MKLRRLLLFFYKITRVKILGIEENVQFINEYYLTQIYNNITI